VRSRRLSRTSGLIREQRGLGPPRLKLAQSTYHTWLGHTFKVKSQQSRSPGRFTHRGLNMWGRCSARWLWERIGRGKLLLRCVCSVAREPRWGAHGWRRGAGALSCRHAHSLFFIFELGRQKSYVRIVRMSSYVTVRLSVITPSRCCMVSFLSLVGPLLLIFWAPLSLQIFEGNSGERYKQGVWKSATFDRNCSLSGKQYEIDPW